jgi:predicted dehydrogenase
VHDPEQGGGRIIGEVCHFVDLLIFLCGAIPRRVWARALPNKGLYRNDNLVITLEFTNESLGTITYVANGDKAFPKEKLEIYGGGRVAVLHNFRRLELWRNGRRRVERSWWGQDKGHPGEWEAFYNASRMSRHLPIPIEEIVATSLTTFGISKAISDSVPVKIYPNEILAAL